MSLDRCASCNRHVRADASACPFCRANRAASALAAGLTALALTGCPAEKPPAPVYGAITPPRSTEVAPVSTEADARPDDPPAPVYGAPPPPNESAPR